MQDNGWLKILFIFSIKSVMAVMPIRSGCRGWCLKPKCLWEANLENQRTVIVTAREGIVCGLILRIFLPFLIKFNTIRMAESVHFLSNAIFEWHYKRLGKKLSTDSITLSLSLAEFSTLPSPSTSSPPCWGRSQHSFERKIKTSSCGLNFYMLISSSLQSLYAALHPPSPASMPPNAIPPYNSSSPYAWSAHPIACFIQYLISNWISRLVVIHFINALQLKMDGKLRKI